MEFEVEIPLLGEVCAVRKKWMEYEVITIIGGSEVESCG